MLPEAPSVIVPMGGSFDDATQDALYAAEEVIREGDSSSTPNPPVALIEDHSLVEEDFFVEERKV